jgi:hypothetical protein
MKTKHLHNWNLSYRLAALLQAQLASKIRLSLTKNPASNRSAHPKAISHPALFSMVFHVSLHHRRWA